LRKPITTVAEDDIPAHEIHRKCSGVGNETGSTQFGQIKRLAVLSWLRRLLEPRKRSDLMAMTVRWQLAKRRAGPRQG
jgi:hypothetical protein